MSPSDFVPYIRLAASTAGVDIRTIAGFAELTGVMPEFLRREIDTMSANEIIELFYALKVTA